MDRRSWVARAGAGVALLASLASAFGSAGASARRAPVHRGVRGGGGDVSRAGPGRTIRLPADAAAHAGAAREWWYVVGHLSDAAGRTYGFETTIAKVGGIQKVIPGSPYDTDYHTDVSITDDAARRFYQQMSFFGPQGVGLDTRALNVRTGRASITTVGALSYRVRGAMPGASSDLVVTSTRPALLVGGGLVPWGTGGGYSYYYSLTNMRATGTLTIGRRRIAVHGIAWMDHQWGNWASLDVRPAGVRSWEWMGMQLDDGTSINMAQQNTDRGEFGGASALLPDNRQVPTITGVTITPLGRWRSPATHTVYPSGWRVRVPSLKLDVIVRPTVRGQELVDSWEVMGYRLGYYEGRCTVTGTHAGRRVSGATYTELIGYGAPQ